MTVMSWLAPLQAVLDPISRLDWEHLDELTATLDSVVVAHPIGPDLPAGVERSRKLLAIRRALAMRGYANTSRHAGLIQMLGQFICGYVDLDLRDAIGLGHGQLIARHGAPQARQRWIPRLLAGELAGIAVTEPHGGSRPAATRTQAAIGTDGVWLVSGRKTWISRLAEAAVFVVFFRAPDGRLAAAAVDASEPGLHRQQLTPAGLAGWSWGILELDAVPLHRQDVLDGDGMVLLREHFARYRPLVTATALGGAAAVFDTAASALAARVASGEVPRLRDSALVTLGRTHAQIATALLGAAVAAHFADIGDGDAELWSAATKAHGVDVANQTAAEVACCWAQKVSKLTR